MKRKTGRPRTEEKHPGLYTRVKASEVINVNRNTLREYEELAIFACVPYRESVQVDGRTQVRKPLTAYQVWVLGKIRMMYSRIPQGAEGTAEITRFLKNNPHKLNQEAWLNEISQPLTA